MSLSAAEFEALQLQLIELKEGKYESQEREKKLNNEIKHLKEHVASLENDLKKVDTPTKGSFSFSELMSKGKGKDQEKLMALASENDTLNRRLELAAQEYKEQQDATMQSVKNLYATNKQLEEELENLKKAGIEKDRKIEAQEGQLRKFQVKLLQFETSADIHHTSDANGVREGEKESSDSQESEHTKEEGSAKLEEENNRLRENVKLLSTQFQELDEQLAKSEESYRAQIATLEQQVATSREKIKQDEIASARMEARLEEELTKVLKDKEELITKLSTWEEQGKKDKVLTDQVDNLQEQVADLSDKLSTVKISRDEYMEQVKKVTMELDAVLQEKSKLESQLQMLEDEAGLLRKVRDEHSVVLTEFEAAKASIKKLEADLEHANAECASLKSTQQELAQARQDIETANQHANTLQAELDALKSEAEALRLESSKVAPLEQEVEGLKLAHLQAATSSSTYHEQYEAERRKLIDVESSLQDTSAKLKEATAQMDELKAQVAKLLTEKDDLRTEHQINDRKSQRMIKELKSELQRERSTTSISRSASMEILVPSSPAPSGPQRHSPPMSPVPLTPPHHHHHHQPMPHTPQTPRMTRQQAEAVNALPLVSTNIANLELAPSTMEEILRRDLDTALTMVGKLGEDKWKLEEKARFLEENLALVNEDLVRKTKVIQHYVNKTKLVVTPEQVADKDKTGRRQSGVRGTLLRAGNDQELSAELLAKMEAVLEETVLRNVQLQTDMVTLGNETGLLQNELKQVKDSNRQLLSENTHYKDQLVRLMSNHVG